MLKDDDHIDLLEDEELAFSSDRKRLSRTTWHVIELEVEALVATRPS
jgi:hypothetical protein